MKIRQVLKKGEEWELDLISENKRDEKIIWRLFTRSARIIGVTTYKDVVKLQFRGTDPQSCGECGKPKQKNWVNAQE